jgi:copper chaperone CopZ
MKLISKMLVAITVLLSFTSCEAQIKNAKTETVKIYGNCGMCEKRIEKAGSINDIAIVDWNVDTKIATITYDSKKTNQDAILKSIALSGHDSDTFLAPNEAYSKLPSCCQYDRVAKVPVKTDGISGADKSEHSEMSNHTNHTETPKVEVQQVNQLIAVFDNYFAVKDALVKTDGNTASAKATALLSTINAVKMETLKSDEHMTWMKVVANLKEDTKHIADTKDAKHQRDHFDTLSKSIYELIKVSKQETPTYLQHCPMANDGKGADWLSKENTVKNPYYGSMMLTCGKTVETIK